MAAAAGADAKAASPMFRLVWLDTLRGAAAIWVVLFHLNEPRTFEPSAYQTFVSLGWLGVSVFFVISGVSMAHAVQTSRNAGQFLIRRFWRIYPPYLASLAVIVGLVIARRLEHGFNDYVALPDTAAWWLATITLATKPVTSFPTINWVYWSLSYEIGFYILSAIGPHLRDGRQSIALLAVTVVAAALPVAGFPGVFPLSYWAFFSLGWSVARTDRPISIWTACALIAAADLVLNHASIEAAAALLTAGSVLAARYGAAAWLNRPTPFTRVAPFSYSLYLLHVPVGCYVVLRPLDHLRTNSLLSHVCVDLFVLGLTGLAAWIFSLAVERPALAAGRRLSRGAKAWGG